MSILDPITEEEHERIRASVAKVTRANKRFIIEPREKIEKPDPFNFKFSGFKFRGGER